MSTSERGQQNVALEHVLAHESIVPKVLEHVRSQFLRGEDVFREAPKEIHIYYMNQPFHKGEEFKDILGQSEPFLALGIEGSHGILFLLDPTPSANWAHPCWVATFDLARSAVRAAQSNFPPQESVERRLVCCATYFDDGDKLVEFLPPEECSPR
jgi:hypothetical protein